MAANNSRYLQQLGFFALLLLLLTASLHVKTPKAVPPQKELQAYDAFRHILFSANTGDGSIRVLNLFHNVAQIGNLRSAGRRSIHDLRLVPGGHSLWVLADDGIYRYDTHTLQQTAFQRLNTAASQHFGCVAENAYVLQDTSGRPIPGA